MKARISVILRVLISLGLVIFLLWSMRDEFPSIKNTLVKTDLFMFFCAVLLFMLNLSIISLRLKLLFVGEGLRIPLGRVIQLTFIGYFFNNFMPTAVGGDIIKAYYAYKQTNKIGKSFISVFMDRFIGLSSFVFIAAFTLLISWKNVPFSLKKPVFTFALLGILSFIVILNTAIANFIFNILSKFKLWNIGGRLSNIYRAVHEYKSRKTLLFMAIGISLMCQSIYFLVIYLLTKSFQVHIFITTVFLIMPIVSVVSMLPSLGGLGLREGAIVVLFGPIIGNENAFSVGILLLAMLLITSLVGALIYAFASQFKIKKIELSKMEY